MFVISSLCIIYYFGCKIGETFILSYQWYGPIGQNLGIQRNQEKLHNSMISNKIALCKNI